MRSPPRHGGAWTGNDRFTNTPINQPLAETGVAPGRAVMVGDTTYDIEMAANAGIAGIGVSWGHHGPADLLAAGAEIVVDDFAGLARALDAFREEHA